jgi:hypothetical protein
MYEYRMQQIPPAIVVSKASKGTEAAAYLEGIVNDMASDGWEFFRVDTIGVQVQPGCLGILGGQRQTNNAYYVVTFRREV